MDTILGFLHSLAGTTNAQSALFVVTTGITVFLFALGVSFLVLATMDPVRRRLGAMAADSRPSSDLAARLLKFLEPVNRFVLPSKGSERGKMEQKLMYAGLRSANAISNASMARLVCKLRSTLHPTTRRECTSRITAT